MNERIRQVRKTLKLTQADFGSRIGVKESTICKYESSLRNPSNLIILSICRVFHVNETWLRTGEGEMFLNNKEENLNEKMLTNLLAICKVFEKAAEKCRKEGRIQILVDLVKDNLLSVSNAAKKLEVTEEEFLNLMKKEDRRKVNE